MINRIIPQKGKIFMTATLQSSKTFDVKPLSIKDAQKRLNKPVKGKRGRPVGSKASVCDKLPPIASNSIQLVMLKYLLDNQAKAVNFSLEASSLSNVKKLATRGKSFSKSDLILDKFCAYFDKFERVRDGIGYNLVFKDDSGHIKVSLKTTKKGFKPNLKVVKDIVVKNKRGDSVVPLSESEVQYVIIVSTMGDLIFALFDKKTLVKCESITEADVKVNIPFKNLLVVSKIREEDVGVQSVPEHVAEKIEDKYTVGYHVAMYDGAKNSPSYVHGL
jgi:hypothetical protein